MYKKTNAMFRLGSLSDDDYDDAKKWICGLSNLIASI